MPEPTRVDKLLIVCGAARSGSTSLAQSLGSSPSVAPSRPKEPHFLALGHRAASFNGPNAAPFDLGRITSIREYRKCFEGPGVPLDASMSTMPYHKVSYPVIDSLVDRPRLLFVLRNPIDRLVSAHRYLVARGYENLALEDALKAEPSRRADNWNHLWWHLTLSSYAEPVRAAIERFGRQSVLVLLTEEMRLQPDDSLHRIARFTGIPDLASCSLPADSNASRRPPRWPTLMRTAERIAANHPSVRDIDPAMKVWRKLKQSRLSQTKEREELDPATRNKLVERLGPDVSALEAALGRTVGDYWPGFYHSNDSVTAQSTVGPRSESRLSSD